MALETRSFKVLRFGTFEVDLRAGELRKQGVRIKVQEQPFHVLTVLLQRAGEVVTREELRNQNWPPDTFVDFDNSLNTAINKLREALGDSADNPRFIETLPRRGYRFIAPVTGLETKVAARTSGFTRRWLAAVAATAVVVAIAAGGLYWRSRHVQRLTARDTIVLADFTNATGDPVFDDTLKQGLRVQLEQSPFLSILSDQKVGKELQLMGRSKDDRLTQNAAKEVCERAGSKVFLAGSISSLGTHYVVGLKALNCQSGDVVGSTQMEADSREHVLKALGDSATKMRQKLGESLATIEKYDAPVEVTTPSLEALKAYSLGMKTWSAKGDMPSLPFFKLATEFDPKFAMAYARVAMVYDNVGEQALAIENMKKAYQLGENVSEWEKLYLKAHYYDRVTGELEKAVQAYEVWQQIYPRDSVPYNNLRGMYAGFGNYDRALQEGREALRLDPDNEDNYFTLGYVYIALNRLDDAGAVFKQAEDRKLEGGGLLWGRYLLAFFRDDTKDLEGLALSAESDPSSRLNLRLWTGRSLGDHGKLRAARDLWQREARSAENSKAMGWAALLQAVTASMEAYLGDVQGARAHAKAAAKAGMNREAAVNAAYALAVAGDVNGAEKHAAELDRRFPSDTLVKEYWLPTIRAALALDRKNAREGVELLRAASPYELGTMGRMEPVYIRGQAYLMLRDGDAAAAEFQKILDHRTIVQLHPAGVLAHLGLARAWALQGNTAKSRAAYQDLFALWKNADADIPVLKQAKAEYAKLQ